MVKRSFCVLLGIIVGLCCLAQSQRSNELFAKGLKLYKAKKYKKAIPLFVLCDSIDYLEMDSTSNRRDYSKHWIASCYYHLGDTAAAAKWHFAYYTPPVDRRLTVASDSAASRGYQYYLQQQYEEAFRWYDKCRELETEIMGEEHFFVANDYMSMANLCLYYGDTIAAARNYGKAADIRYVTLGTRSELTYDACSSASYVSMWVKNFPVAKNYMLKAMEIRRNLSGAENEEYLKLIADYEYVLKLLQEWPAALENRKEEAAIREHMADKETVDYIRTLNYCALYAYRSKLWEEAAHFSEEATSLQAKVLGEFHPDLLTNLNNLAAVYSQMGNDTMMVSVAERQLAIIDYAERKGLMDKYKLTGESGQILRSYLYRSYQNMLDYEKALLYAQQFRDDLEQAGDTDSDLYAQTLKDVGSLQYKTWKYDEALHTDSLAMQLYTKLKGPEYREVLNVLNNISVVFFAQKKYAEAIATAEQVLALRRKLFGDVSSEVAHSLVNLSNMCAEKKDYDRGEMLGEEALAIYLHLYGDSSYVYRQQCSLLASIYEHHGEELAYQHATVEANLFFDRALHYVEAGFGRQSTEYANLLTAIAMCDYNLGLYTRAIEREQKALSIYELTVGKEQSAYTTTLTALLYMSQHMNDWSLYRRYAEEYYTITEKKHGTENVHTAEAMLWLGKAYYYCGDANFFKSTDLYRNALELTRRTAGQRSVQYARALEEYIGNPNVEDWTEAKIISMLEEAVDILEENYGKDSGQISSPLNTLGGHYVLIGDYKNAIRAFERLLSIKQKDREQHLSDIITGERNICSSLYYDGQMDRLIDYAPEVTAIEKDQVMRSFSTMTEYERNRFWNNSHANWFNDEILSYARASGNDSLKVLAYDAQLFSKGLLLNTEKELQRQVLQSGDSLNIARLQHLNALRSQLNRKQRKLTVAQGEERVRLEAEYNVVDSLYFPLISKEYRCKDSLEKKRIREESEKLLQKRDSLYTELRRFMTAPLGQNMSETALLQHQIDDEERQLLSSVRFSDELMRPLNITCRDVASSLPPHSAAIEFVCFQDTFDISKDTRGEHLITTHSAYYAFVLKHGQKTPVLLRLADKKTLDSMTVDSVFASPRLLAMVWKPLEGILSDVSSVYMSPTGVLHCLPIECLPGTERWNIYRLSSTRELSMHTEGRPLRKASLYGGLRYDVDYAGMLDVDAAKTGRLRSVVMSIPELPGSLTEIKVIDRLLKTNNIDVEARTEAAGTEASFKSLEGTPISLLHISTHGFYNDNYLPQIDKKGWHHFNETNDQLNRKFSYDEMYIKERTEDRTLSSCGLFLAGATNYLWGDERADPLVDDGILTAKEISRLDFSNLDMVVLSACETALGDVTGDGVFGLQRGFKKAGAQSILMSLWKVDDEATCLLMTEFYKNWIGEKMTKHDALEVAKQTVRSHKEKGWDAPKYWAAFILLDGLD